MELQVPAAYGEGAKQVTDINKRIAAKMEILHPLPFGYALRAARLPEIIDTVLLNSLGMDKWSAPGKEVTASAEVLSRKRLKPPRNF